MRAGAARRAAGAAVCSAPMNTSRDIARSLTLSLSLARPPIAVSFADAPPAGVPRFAGKAPAGCHFWEEAARGPIATSTADHELCSIGVHTHNLASPSARHADELARTLAVMADLDYVREEEVAKLPTVAASSRHVIYAPLAEAPLAPDAVLVFADSRQGLILAEAVGRVDAGAAPALGRPACAAIPQALATGRAALSLGCCGARAYLDAFADEVALWALPGARLAEYAAAVESLATANQTLARFHRLRRADVAAGRTPSVDESLHRLEEPS
jgi:uncharacterized protein (DUF169 family)